jgi:RimJ/RimL family protein N-acetyltransferase
MNDVAPQAASKGRLPRNIDLGGETLMLHLMSGADETAVLAFAKAAPAHDLLFLARDITHPKVVKAWVRDIEAGTITTVLAWRGGEIVGCAAIFRDVLSWSGHVAEIRVVLLDSLRGKGLGRLLTEEAFAIALAQGAEKITARMTLDQKGAIAVFEGLGFTLEAMLRDQVKDRDGRKHDLLILSHDVARMSAQHEAYGLGEAF